MSDFDDLCSAQDRTRWRRAAWEDAAARLELAQRDERAAYLLSQHLPVAVLGLDRERLRLALRYLIHGDLARLDNERKALQTTDEGAPDA